MLDAKLTDSVPDAPETTLTTPVFVFTVPVKIVTVNGKVPMKLVF